MNPEVYRNHTTVYVQWKALVESIALKLDHMDLQASGGAFVQSRAGLALVFLAEDNHLFYRAVKAECVCVHKGVW